MALAQEIHRRATRLGISTVAGSLHHVLGQRLVAVLAGVRDAEAVGKWARAARAPHPDAEQRLRRAYRIMQLLIERESAETIRACFVGMNSGLDDQAPALMLSAEDSIRVL